MTERRYRHNPKPRIIFIPFFAWFAITGSRFTAPFMEHELKFSDSSVGLTIGIQMGLASLLGGWGGSLADLWEEKYSKNSKNRGRANVVALGIGIGTVAFLLHFITSFWDDVDDDDDELKHVTFIWNFILRMIYAISLALTLPVMDGLTLAHLEGDMESTSADYGKERLWGAVSFGVAHVVSGICIDIWGFKALYSLTILSAMWSFLSICLYVQKPNDALYTPSMNKNNESMDQCGMFASWDWLEEDDDDDDEEEEDTNESQSEKSTPSQKSSQSLVSVEENNVHAETRPSENWRPAMEPVRESNDEETDGPSNDVGVSSHDYMSTSLQTNPISGDSSSLSSSCESRQRLYARGSSLWNDVLGRESNGESGGGGGAIPLWHLLGLMCGTITRIFFLLSFFNLRVGLYVVEQLSFLFFEFLGGSYSMCGLVVVFSVLLEIPIFIIAPTLLKRLGPVILLQIASASYVMRVVGYILVPKGMMGPILLLDLLHGVTFAFSKVGTVEFVANIMPNGYEASGQGLLSFFQGMGAVVGLPLGGWVEQTEGPRVMYGGLAVLVSGGMLLLAGATSCHLPQKRPSKENAALLAHSSNL